MRRRSAAGRPWTAGVMVSWSPFSGGAELAARREATARRAGAAASAEAAEARGVLELADAVTSLEVAQARMRTGARAVEQSAEAHRIVSRKYEGGCSGHRRRAVRCRGRRDPGAPRAR